MDYFIRLAARVRAWWHELIHRPAPCDLAPEPLVPEPVSTEPPEPLVALLWLAPVTGGQRLVEATVAPGGEPRWRIVCTPASALERNQALLDRFEALNTAALDAEVPLDLWLACRPVRAQMRLFETAFPNVILRDYATDAHKALRRLVEEALLPAREPATTPAPAPAAEERVASPRRPAKVPAPRLTVATDASAAHHGSGMGIACVSERGAFAQEYVDRGVDPTVGEVLAIDLALRTFPNARLHVHTDSRNAIRLLADPATSLDKRFRTPVRDRLVKAVGSGRLRLTWVRGHNGHALNETADRLAMAARRGVQLNQPQGAQREVAEHIVADLLRTAA